jgi:hypothetical protein
MQGRSVQQLMEITPAVRTVKLSCLTKEPLRAESFVEAVERTARIAEQQHGGNALLEEALGDSIHEPPSQSVSMEPAQDINLVKLPGKAWHTAVMKGSFGEPTSSPC